MTPELEKMVQVVDNLLHQYGLHAVITSGNDGYHSLPGSLHYRNQALDFRTYDWPDVKEFAVRIKALLGPKYDVVVETNHLHIEYEGG
ncbi:MAG: hypothetical protein [Microviridae sp. ctzVR26]|nr:MAG: hypothetical protein [Microviridae sp. ctzVR26]